MQIVITMNSTYPGNYFHHRGVSGEALRSNPHVLRYQNRVPATETSKACGNQLPQHKGVDHAVSSLLYVWGYINAASALTDENWMDED